MTSKHDIPDAGPICALCCKKITDAEYVQALQRDWHSLCFTCSQCKQRLSSWYFERDKKLYCQKDYWAQFGESCQGCAQLIAGPVMVAGEHKFHPDCFVCSNFSDSFPPFPFNAIALPELKFIFHLVQRGFSKHL
eukprot:XP_011667891.1 PREDICTED: LIM domain kinase 1-like [Strongylocentrotus purpuratus]